jgi:peptidoglycan L-alanyl-D-glutamate endopeptidase CwlK
MPIFSQLSKTKLATCHIDLQVLFNEVVKYYDCTVVCGYRGEGEQTEAWVKGNSQLKWPNSKHNSTPSNAVDVVPFEKSGVDYGKMQSAFFAGMVKGIAIELKRKGTITHDIRIGLDWNGNNDVDDTKFWDACHFEIINTDIN